MFPSLGGKQRIGDSDSTEFYERRVVVRGGSINTVTLSALRNAEILRVCIPNSIIVVNWHRPPGQFGIGKEHGLLQSIVFESNSRLTRIESEIFSDSSLQSIIIPRNVQFIDGSAFDSVTLSSISIESGNEIFVIENDFLIDILHHKLIQNFSESSVIEIGMNIEILGSSCFSNCESFSSITFESDSHLTRIESEAFSFSSLKSILIPRNVEFIDGSAFGDVRLSSISIEIGNETFGI
jgi:hypothetical protein